MKVVSLIGGVRAVFLFMFLYYTIDASSDFVEVQRQYTIYKQEHKGEEVSAILRLRILLNNMGIRHIDVVMAQIFHETGALTSNIYKECKNLFGMKYNTRGYAKGVCRGHAKYDSYMDSIRDYAEWQRKYLTIYEKRNGRVITVDDYLRFLTQIGYAEDRNYCHKLTIWVNLLKQI